jgi:hypothetical protein
MKLVIAGANYLSRAFSGGYVIIAHPPAELGTTLLQFKLFLT